MGAALQRRAEISNGQNNPENIETVTTEQLTKDIHPFWGEARSISEETSETISKLKAVITMISCCQDEENLEFRITNGDVAWALILAGDLAEEAARQEDLFRDHVLETWRKLEQRLDACHVMKFDSEGRGSDEQ